MLVTDADIDQLPFKPRLTLRLEGDIYYWTNRDPGSPNLVHQRDLRHPSPYTATWSNDRTVVTYKDYQGDIIAAVFFEPRKSKISWGRVDRSNSELLSEGFTVTGTLAKYDPIFLLPEFLHLINCLQKT